MNMTIKDIPEAQTPYPARRRYRWAESDIMMTYEQASRMFAKLRLQAYSAGDTKRYKAFDLTIKSLAALAEQRGISDFPGPKLHKLLCKAALAAGWCTDLNKIQRSRVAKLAPDQADYYICPSCGESKHVFDFLVPATTAQCTKWGWGSSDKMKKVRGRVCRACTDKTRRDKAAKTRRIDATRRKKEYEQTLADHGPAAVLPLAEAYWTDQIKRLLHSNKIAHGNSAHQPTLDYYALRETLLNRALDNLPTAINDKKHIDTWLALLDAEDSDNFYKTYAKLLEARRNAYFRGPPPSL